METPSAREREGTLRLPLYCAAIDGTVWVAAAGLFAGLNATVSLDWAWHVGATILMGGTYPTLLRANTNAAGELGRNLRAVAGLGAYEGAETLDADGAYVVPGFIDAHVHIGLSDPAAVVRGGVTTVRDLAWPVADIFASRGEQEFRAMEHAITRVIRCASSRSPSPPPSTPQE